MLRLLSLFAVIIAAPLLLAPSCDRSQCPQDTICTDLFAMVTVQVAGGDGASVTLDEVYTIRKSNNEVIRPEQQMEGGYYVVLDDTYQKKLQKQKDVFNLVGMKDGKEVVNEPFTISADCCHIQKVSGADAITLRP